MAKLEDFKVNDAVVHAELGAGKVVNLVDEEVHVQFDRFKMPGGFSRGPHGFSRAWLDENPNTLAIVG